MSYYMTNSGPAAAGFDGYGGYGAFGGLFFDEGKAFWLVQDASETLSSIATKVYGDVTAQKAIYNANPQGRWPTTKAAGCPDQKWNCWGWYKKGTQLVLPKIPGFPDPMASAPKSGLAPVTEGTTIVKDSGETLVVTKGGSTTSTKKKLAQAGLSTGAMVGIGVAAAIVLGGAAMLAKRKKTGTSTAMTER